MLLAAWAVLEPGAWPTARAGEPVVAERESADMRADARADVRADWRPEALPAESTALPARSEGSVVDVDPAALSIALLGALLMVVWRRRDQILYRG
ncbi:MAG: hypothetical protein JNJ71_21185 [Rubrivivax sp.]|nr:hypothetical protein [Rubrivivax sp.]